MPLFQTQPFPTSPLEGWQAPTLLNGWSNYGYESGPAGYWKDPFGIVHLRGLLTGGTITLRAFILPEGYRPPYHMVFSAPSQDLTGSFVFCRCDIDTNGDFLILTGSNFYVSLDGISFRVA